MSQLKKDEILYERAKKVLPGGASRNQVLRQPHPVYAASASGSYLTDVNGKQYIDFSANIGSLIHGHAHPKIIEAAYEQMKKGTAYMVATEVEVEYAEYMINRIKSFDKIRFLNSGTEAVMHLTKVARAFTGRSKIAKCEGAYHGTYDVIEVSEKPNPSNWGDKKRPNSVPHTPGVPKGVLDSVVIVPYNDLENTINILEANKDDLACIIIDPMPHRINMLPASQEYVETIYDWTRKNGSLFCFDEVITFRVHYSGMQECYNVQPDLTSLGKIIGGGFPIGAFGGRNDIMEVLDPIGQYYKYPLSGTFSANPISLTAGLTTMKLFDQEAVNNLNTLTDKARSLISEAIKIAQVPVSMSGDGSIIRLHFSDRVPIDYRENYYNELNQKDAIKRFLDYLYDHGIICVNSLTFFFNTTMTDKEINILADTLLDAFKEIKPYFK
ncbi:MAG TPA: aspartate aminotransferase family protein [Bacteroidales bacterium]|nr:aspartate aminotransferase family protein [Bacteroidales bacterium]